MKRRQTILFFILFFGIIIGLFLPGEVRADCGLITEYATCAQSADLFGCRCDGRWTPNQICFNSRITGYSDDPNCPVEGITQVYACTPGSDACGGGGTCGCGSINGKVCNSTNPESDPNCLSGGSYSSGIPGGIYLDYWGVSTGDDPSTTWITEQANTDITGRVAYTPGSSYYFSPGIPNGKYAIKIDLSSTPGWNAFRCKTWLGDGLQFQSSGGDTCYFYVGCSGADSGSYFAISQSTYHCERCSTSYGCAWTEYSSLTSCPGTPIEGTISYVTDCNRCSSIPGKDNSRCSSCPVDCARCSVINGCEWTQYKSLHTDCSTVDSEVTRTTNCSCPSIPGGNNSRCPACATPTSIPPTPTPVNSPPSAPTLSSPADGSTCQNTSLTLSWNGVSSWGLCRPTQNNHYLVYLGNSGWNVLNGASTTSTSYSVNLSPGTTYWWRVETDNGCLRNASAIWSFTSIPNAPANPTCSGSCSLASAPEANTACSVDWNDVSGANHYALRIDDLVNTWSNTCDWTYPDDYCLDVSPSYYAYTGKGGHSYKAWVHTIDYCGQWSTDPTSCYFTALACPAAPSNLMANRVGCDAKLTWADNSTNETGFMIQRVLDGGGFADWRSVGVGVTGTTDTNVFCGTSPAASAQYRVSATYSTCPRVYSNTATATCPLTASLGLSTNLVTMTIGQGPIPAFSYQVTFECGSFDHIAFTGYDAGLITVNPVSSTSQTGVVNITAGSSRSGTTTITATAYLNPGGVVADTETVTVEVEAPEPWWQTVDGDVHANDSITCLIPDLVSSNKYLSLPGGGGDPGVVSYGGSIEMGDGDVSSENWQANTTYHEDEINFDYLMNRLNVDTTVTFTAPPLPTDSKTYYLNGPSELDGANIGTKKIIVFVNGNATVKGDITVDNGGFFALVAKGNITFTDTVTSAQGFYLADNVLSIASGTSLFEGEGSFIGWNGVDLQRDLGASSLNLTPSELFTFRPDLLINAPKEFLFTPFVFQEVAP